MSEAKRPSEQRERVDRLVRLLRWPEKKGNGLVPWFVIAWRVMFMPLVYGGLAVAWVGVLCANGYRQACYFWRSAT